MSMGGNFYAISDDQLVRLLDETLSYVDFLNDMLDEKPKARFSSAEYFWYELTELLDIEKVRGLEITERIPEAAGYSFSNEVKAVFNNLSKLSNDELQQRFEKKVKLMKKITLEEMLRLVKGLTDFYQYASSDGKAVLFRVT